MKKVGFNIQKWSVRAVIALGAVLGISACTHTKKVVEDNNYNNYNNNNNNYNNNINYNNNNTPPVHNHKYGPLVNFRNERPILINNTDEDNGNVNADTISSSSKNQK